MPPGKSGRQKLGQHFLQDARIIEKIIECSAILETENVLEIGPGKGALTHKLSGLGKRLILIEPDEKLASNIIRAIPEAELIVGKAEDTDLSTLPEPLIVVSNLPYFASVNILQHLTRHKNRIARMVLMFQKEVADRISATPGGRNYGSLTLYCRYHWDIEKVISAGSASFTPPPKVDSVVLRFYPKLTAPVEGDEDKLFTLIRSAFGQKRKTVRNNLKQYYSKEALDGAFSSTEIGDKTRAEELTLDNFSELLRSIEARLKRD